MHLFAVRLNKDQLNAVRESFTTSLQRVSDPMGLCAHEPLCEGTFYWFPRNLSLELHENW